MLSAGKDTSTFLSAEQATFIRSLSLNPHIGSLPLCDSANRPAFFVVADIREDILQFPQGDDCALSEVARVVCHVFNLRSRKRKIESRRFFWTSRSIPLPTEPYRTRRWFVA